MQNTQFKPTIDASNPGGGGTPYMGYMYIGMSPKGYGFLSGFGHKQGIDLALLVLNRYGFVLELVK